MARAAIPEGADRSDPARSLSDRRLRTLRRGLEIIAVRRLANTADAADAAQESLTRALEAAEAGRIPGGVPFEAFLHGIHRHVVTDVIRRRAREPESSDTIDWHASPEPDALGTLIANERIEALRVALGCLSDEDRRLLRTCFFEGERIVDIARRTDQPPARIRKRKSRAMARLRDALAGGEPPAGHASKGDST